MNITASEKVAVLTAMQRRVKEELDKAREELESEMLSTYEDNGSINRELRVFGEPVGKCTMKFTKPGVQVTNLEELTAFGADYGFATERISIKPGYEHEALEYISFAQPELVDKSMELTPGWERYMAITRKGIEYLDSGLIVPGVEILPASYKNMMVTGCKFDDVYDVVSLNGSFTNYLMEGDNE